MATEGPRHGSGRRRRPSRHALLPPWRPSPTRTRRLDDAVSAPFRVLTWVVLSLLLIGGLTTAVDLRLFAPRLHRAWTTVSVLQAAQRAMVDQETGVRGFLLAPAGTGRPFLDPYSRGRAEDSRATQQLERLAPSAPLAAAFAARERAAEAWHVRWAQPALQDPVAKSASADFLLDGKALFDRYRAADTAAADLLQAHLAALLRWQRVVAVSSGGVSVLVVIAALLAVRRTRRQLLGAVAAPLSGIAAAVDIGPGGDLSGTLTPTDIDELNALAQNVAALFATLADRDAELRAHAHELEVLGAASRALLTDPDPRNAICRAAASITGATSAVLLEADGGGSLSGTASFACEVGRVRLPLDGESLAVHVFRHHTAVLVEDLHGDPRVAQQWVEDHDAVGGIWLPVMSEQHCLGVLVVFLPVAALQLSTSIPASLTVLADAAAAAIDRVDLHDRLAQQARTDGLTGVANRRTWDDQLPAELARATRTGKPLTVAILDLDHFKAYNDTRGHQAGDQLLRTAAHRWHARLRTTDLIARYGGEEFAVALPDCDTAAAVHVLQTLSGELPDAQTCSIGVAEWDGCESGHDLLARADRALYRAKRTGRDRITVEPSGAVGHLVGVLPVQDDGRESSAHRQLVPDEA